MKFSRDSADVYVPDGSDADAALARVTHVAVAAHADDVEIMAFEGILATFGLPDKHFVSVIMTDGAGSLRDGLYASYTDEQMRMVRKKEQKKAAYIGEYSAVAFLDHPSSAIKNPANPDPHFRTTGPEILSVNWRNNSGTIQTVSSGSFNGDVSAYTLDTNVHAYEIIHFVMGTWFYVDNVLIHQVAPTTDNCPVPTRSAPHSHVSTLPLVVRVASLRCGLQ